MQNVVSIAYTSEELAQMDSALLTLRELFARMVKLTPEDRRELFKMGDKTEPFSRQTLTVLAANPQIVPPNLGLAEAQADLTALDALRPRLLQLQQLLETAEDTETALGSDILSVALEGYGLLKVSGKNEALKAARKALSARWSKSNRGPQVPPAV